MAAIHEFIRQTASTPVGDCEPLSDYRQIFANMRSNSGEICGLRLTKEGLKTLRRHFEAWTFPMPDGFMVKPCHLLYFDRHAVMPWYLDNHRLVLFEAKLAMRAKLAGDIDRLMVAFTDNPHLPG